MNKLCRLPLLLALLVCLALVPTGRADAAPPPLPPPVARQVLGPGMTTEPGFVGYVTAGGAALGIARLPDGRYGICLDTGHRVWPRHAGHDARRHDPRAGYLLSRYLPAARRDPVTAAALWWAVGLDLRLNSGRVRMRRHLSVVRHEDGGLFRRIQHRHRALLADLRAHASASGRYLAQRPVLGATRVIGVAVRTDSGVAVPGVEATIRLTGGTFDDGRRTWRGAAAGGGPRWQRSGGGAVHLRVRYAAVPASGYELVRSGARYQRVAVGAGAVVRTAGSALPPLPRPTLRTTVSVTRSTVGAVVSDAVTVSGSQGATLSGHWRLLGPVAPGTSGCADATWAGAAVAGAGGFTTTGDGTYQVGTTTIRVAGCYTYVERLDASSSTRTTSWTPPGETTETVLVLARPGVSTQVSSRRTAVGGPLHDAVTVTGLPVGVAVRVHWRLVGPVAPVGDTCAGADWAGAPTYASGELTIFGGVRTVIGRRVARRGGCYTYQERLEATRLSVASAWTRPGVAAETAAVTPRTVGVPAHPYVDTGGSRRAARGLRTTGTAAGVRIPGSSSVVPLSPMAFRAATLTPPSVDVGGWWTGGARLDALAGTTIVAGHVSDDHDRLGPFARLRRTRVGAVVATTWAGITSRWRVVAVRSYDRRRLPRSLFSQHLARRLVLITCTDEVTGPGGAFHYRRNLVVTAVPLRT
ncbi:sortase domain-containing protein [Nocardioides ultimimeridianus]